MKRVSSPEKDTAHEDGAPARPSGITPRDGAQDTAKISKEVLDQVLKRTSNSGVRPALRPGAPKSGKPIPREEPTEAAKPVSRLAPGRFTIDEVPTRPTLARPAAIEVGEHDEVESDRLAAKMLQEVERARSEPSLPAAGPNPHALETVPFAFPPPASSLAGLTRDAGSEHDDTAADARDAVPEDAARPEAPGATSLSTATPASLSPALAPAPTEADDDALARSVLPRLPSSLVVRALLAFGLGLAVAIALSLLWLLARKG